MSWISVTTPPLESGWYLVSWRGVNGDDRVDCSEFVVGYGFSDQWCCNAGPVAWMPLPAPPLYARLAVLTNHPLPIPANRSEQNG